MSLPILATFLAFIAAFFFLVAFKAQLSPFHVWFRV
jgi:hypothetical protein